MKAEKTTTAWAVLFLSALLAVGCNNGVTFYYPGGSGDNTDDNSTATGIVESGENDTESEITISTGDSGDGTETDINDDNDEENANKIDSDIDGTESENTDGKTNNVDGNDTENGNSGTNDTDTNGGDNAEDENGNDENENNTNTDNSDEDENSNDGTTDTSGNEGNSDGGNENNGTDIDNTGDTETENDDNENHATFPLLTSTAEVREYLANQTSGKTVDTPVFLRLQIDLGRMMADSTWPQLLTVLKEQGKYVELDLSACVMGRTDFAPRAILSPTGKDKIVALALPNTATSIATGASTYNSAFNGFDNLTVVSMPENIVSIGGYAFATCENLTDCIINAVTPPELGINVFYNAYPTLKIHIPSESVNAYKNAQGWKDLANNIVSQ